MKIIGLTGSIATGKSEVARRLRENGIAVFDADAAVHDIYAEPVSAAKIAQVFPTVLVAGRIDRGLLSAHLAKSPQDLRKLEAIVHPLVRERRQAFLKSHAGQDFVVLDIPLLFETGAEKEMDAVVVVTTTPAEQRRRALARPGMTVEKLELILSRQMPMVEKLAHADFVIENTGTLDDLRRMVDELIPRLRQAPARRS